MTKALKARGETPFDEAGDGLVICFTNADLRVLQEKHGDKFYQDIVQKGYFSGTIDFALLEELLELGIKRDRKPVPPDEYRDGVDRLIVVDVMEKLLDSIFVSLFGQNVKDYLKTIADAIAEAEANGEPPSPQSPDTATSTNSEESVSGPESA